jgi:hypothetical protein
MTSKTTSNKTKNGANGGTLGVEAQLWQATDALHAKIYADDLLIP